MAMTLDLPVMVAGETPKISSHPSATARAAAKLNATPAKLNPDAFEPSRPSAHVAPVTYNHTMIQSLYQAPPKSVSLSA